MGKIIFSFSKNGSIVKDFNNLELAMVHQQYQLKYPLTAIQRIIDYEGKDLIIDVDLDTFVDSSWDKIIYPTDEVRQSISLLIKYQRALNSLIEIEKDVLRFDIGNNPYGLKDLAINAKNIIASLPDSKWLTDISFDKDFVIFNLEHAISQEVQIYLSQKAKDSQIKRTESLRQAKNNLTSEIRDVITSLRSILS